MTRLQHPVDSMLHRVAAVIWAKGRTTRYLDAVAYIFGFQLK